MVLDESPVCVKHLVHGIFMQSATTAKKGTKDIGGGFTVKEEPYLDYVARALGLSGQGQVQRRVPPGRNVGKRWKRDPWSQRVRNTECGHTELVSRQAWWT